MCRTCMPASCPRTFVFHRSSPPTLSSRSTRWITGRRRSSPRSGTSGDWYERRILGLLLKNGDFGHVLHFRKAEVSEGAEHFLLVGGQLLREVAEDEFQRVIVRRAVAQEGER